MGENGTRRRSWESWLAVIAALVVVVFLVWAVVGGDRPPTREQGRVATTGDLVVGTSGTMRRARTTLAPAPVYAYLEFAGIVGPAPRRPMTVRHDYTADGLRALAAALEAMAPAHPEAWHERIDALRARADTIQETPADISVATQVRDAFLSATAMIEAVRREDEPGVRRLAESVNTEQALLSQGDTVRQFFHQSARAIGRISRES
jgi:hypothetical protein